MALSSDLLSQLVKATKPVENKPTEATVYGTTVEQDGGLYVQLDGSDVLTPVSSTVKMESGERVIVSIKNHTAIVTGNLSVQAARSDDVDNIVDEIAEFEIIIADKVSVEEFDAVNGRIDNLVSDNVLIRGSLSAVEATIGDLAADNVVINDKLTANEAAIENLEATSLTADIADLKYASIEDLDAVNAVIYNLDATYASIEELDAAHASIRDLDAKKLSVEQADLKYANIDFANITEAAVEKLFTESGIIKDLIVSDGSITGELVGVTIKGDLIEAGTLKADKLVVKGSDGIYYKLNFEAGTFKDGEAVPDDSLHGSVITAKSITAEKVRVDDLVAFDATIGGFNITDHSLYSGVKESVNNTARGVYLDSDGQVAFGDPHNYLKYFKDTDGTYKLAISAGSIVLSASGKNVEEVIEEALDIEVGARNLLRNSQNMIFSDYYFMTAVDPILTATHDGNGNVAITTNAIRASHDGNGNVKFVTHEDVRTDATDGNITFGL
jgi:hypothetical protein